LRKSATWTLADYSASAKFDDLPGEVVQKAKDIFLDALSNAIAGGSLELSSRFLDIAKKMGTGSPESTLIGTGAKVSAPYAAFGNAALVTMLDFIGGYSGVSWPVWVAGVGVPAALAATEKSGASGKDLLTSFVVGVEVSSRISDSMSFSPSRLVQVMGDSSVVFSAAVSAAKALNASLEEMVSTIGMAGVYAPVSSVRKFLDKGCHPVRDIKQAWAWKSMTGVFAAESAKAGLQMTQDDNILDGDTGFWAMVGADGFREEELTKDLGKKYNIMSVATKSISGCAFTHAPLVAVSKILTEKNLAKEDVDRVEVWVDTLNGSGLTAKEPAGVVEAEFSLPYQISVSLLKIPPGPKWYSKDMLENPEILDFARKVDVITDDSLTQTYNEAQTSWQKTAVEKKLVSKVVVHAKSGKFYEEMADFRKVLRTHDEYQAKFLALASQVASKERTMQIMRTVDKLDSVEHLSELTILFRNLDLTPRLI
jgi:2-methylcitrate dehydratase PrpD